MSLIEECGFNLSSSIYQSTYPSSPSPSPSSSLVDFLLSSLPAPPSKPAFIDAITGDTLTYTSLHSLTLSAANRLRTFFGIKRGDVVLFLSPNSLHFPVLSLAILSLGAVFSPANTLHTRADLSSQVRDSNPSLVLTTAELSPKQVEGLGPGVVLIESFISSMSCDLTPLDTRIGRSDTAALMYSSGTTGLSKGVKCTHANLIAMAKALRHVWRDGPTHVYACVVPLFHMFGFSVFVCGTVAAGATTVVLRKYSLEDMLMVVEEHRVTRIPAVPPMVIQMLRSVNVVAGYNITSLREMICSGAPLGKEHMEKFIDCYPLITLSQVSYSNKSTDGF